MNSRTLAAAAAALATLAACVPEDAVTTNPPQNAAVVVVPPLDNPPVPRGKGPVVVDASHHGPQTSVARPAVPMVVVQP